MKKFIYGLLLGIGLMVSNVYSQEVLDIAFPINGTTVETDSVWIPEGMIPIGVWSSTLIAGTTIGFKVSVDGGSTFLILGDVLNDTTAFSVALDKDAGLFIPFEPIYTYGLKGAYSYESYQLWLQVTTSVAQTLTTTVINVRFTPYTGRQ